MTAITPDRMIIEDGHPQPSGGRNRSYWISEAGGLTQFGAHIEVMPPGCRSSIRHWHSSEDEMIYVLEGQVTLVEGETETVLQPGDAATFKAGVPVGHFLINRSQAPTRCLVMGTRAPVDTITYPDQDRVCHRDRTKEEDRWPDTAGNPAWNVYVEFG